MFDRIFWIAITVWLLVLGLQHDDELVYFTPAIVALGIVDILHAIAKK